MSTPSAMTRLTSPHDNTPDAHQALLNHYGAMSRRKTEPNVSSLQSVCRKRPATRSPAPSRIAPSLSGALERAKRSYNDPLPRPSNLAYGSLWFGIEPDVENTFFRWDGSLPCPPIQAVHEGLRAFQAGVFVGYMAAEPKTALVHVVANEMFKGRISPIDSIANEIQNFLAVSYDRMVSQDRGLALSGRTPSLCHNMEDQIEELMWLKYQAELRWWNITKPREEVEPSESEVNALFDAYTHHSELPPFSWK